MTGEERNGQQRLLAALRAPRAYPGHADRVEIVETHISFVALVGEHAFKVKKAVDLGFLDFRSLAARQRFCAEELRLNRRTAPTIYLDVVPIAGPADEPRVEGDGEPIEWAVKMRRFDQNRMLDAMARRHALDARIIDQLAATVAAFHQSAAVADAGVPFGLPPQVSDPALANFGQIEALLPAGPEQRALATLKRWTETRAGALAGTFTQRRQAKRVRECHGDLHLGNIVLIDDQAVPFDGIEFNDGFRWIDVVSDVAFLVMDLLDRRLDALAWRLLDGWLVHTGDYEGVSVLRFYLVYRAMVRAKVACIRAHQSGIETTARRHVEREFHEYLDLATRLASPSRPALVLMHGLSGSGKTTRSQWLLEQLGAVRVRSDVERKRLAGLPVVPGGDAQPHVAGSGKAANDAAVPAIGVGLYAAAATEATYSRLAAVAETVLAAGYPVIIDAAFLRRTDRDRFRTLAATAGASFAIAHCTAPVPVLRERLAARQALGRDASDATVAVLEAQLHSCEPLADDERTCAVSFGDDEDAQSSDALVQLDAMLLRSAPEAR